MNDEDVLELDYSDDDIKVWEIIYEKAYKSKIIGCEFDIATPYKDGGRYVAQNYKDKEVTISGETDFNFSDKNYVVRGKTKYDFYKQILESIENEERREKCNKLLDYCRDMTHKTGNFSLMQTVGSLQSVKGIFTSTDRIDTYLYILNNYYIGIDEMVLFRCSAVQTINKLSSYLELFRDRDNPENSIFNYCEEVYHIKNRALVKKMIESGKYVISNDEQLVDYMIMAINFWTEKSKYYKSVGISDKWKLRLILKRDYIY